MLNRVIYLIVIVALAAGIFFAGFYAGGTFGEVNHLWGNSILQEEIVDAHIRVRWVDDLRQGETQAVLEDLSFELNVSALLIGNLAEELPVDDVTRRLAYSTLAEIAYQREHSNSGKEIEGISERVDAILHRAKEVAETEGITNRGREQREAAPTDRSP